MKLLAAILISANLAGCAISREVHLADGSKGHNISCDGAANSMGNCFQKAGDLCGARGYYVMNREGQVIPFGSSVGSANIGPYNASAGYITQAGAIVTRSLFVKCRE